MIELVGRTAETEAVAALVRSVRAGSGRSMLLLGEPGIGTSALLDRAAALAGEDAPLRVVRLAGAPGETTLPYGALDRLARDLRGRRLITPTDESPTSRLALCEAALAMVLEAGSGAGLLCLVDDAQWLDRESSEVLAYVRRRLHGARVGVVLASREELVPAAGDEVVPVRALPTEDAMALVAAASPRAFDRVGLERIVAVSAGNPAVLLDLAVALGDSVLRQDQLALQAPPLSAATVEPWLAGVTELGVPARTWLLLAATDRTGRLRTVEAAARVLGLPRRACLDAEAAGVVELGDRVAFRHPLVATAVLARSTAPQRRAAHRALAQVGETEQSPVRAAWHLAAAAVIPDEGAAEHLAAVAGRFDHGMTYLTRAALLARAGELTSDEELRAARLVGAAAHARLAGATLLAEELTAAARPERAPGTDVPPIGGSDFLHEELAVLEVHSRAAAPTEHRAALTHEVADTLHAWRHDDVDPARRRMRATVDRLRGCDDDTTLHLYPYGVLLASVLWDAEAVHQLLANAQQAADRRQATGALATVADLTRAVEVTLGRSALVVPRPAAPDVGIPAPDSSPIAEKWSGHVRMMALVAAGSYRQVLDVATAIEDRLAARSGQLLPEIVEAGAHLGDVSTVREALASFEQVVRDCPSPWSRGLLARSRALTSTIGAEDLFREAIAELATIEASAQVGRTRLLYGEWLRRSRRRRDAADQLRQAHTLLAEVGHPLAERTLRELSLAGASLDDGDADRLTSQELAVAKLAAAGARNAEIAERLFISPHTVDYHLRKVYRKLGISSRRGLGRAVSGF